MPPEAIAQSATLEANEFMLQERAVHLGSARMLPGTVIDMSESDFDFPEGFNIDDYVAYSSPLSNELGSVLVERTTSDGRSLGKYIGQFKDKDGHRYSDIQVKGVGARKEIKVAGLNSPHLGDAKVIGTETALKGATTPGGREYPLRYIPVKTYGIREKFGFSGPQEMAIQEDVISQKLADAGLRTRKLIYSAQFGDEVPISTHEGIKRMPEMEGQLGYRPGIEIWAIRSRYRMVDLQNHSRFLDTENQLLKENSNFIDAERYYELTTEPAHVRARRKLDISEAVMDEVANDFMFMVDEIMKRAEFDDDERFVNLHREFSGRNLRERAEQQRFWESYLMTLGGILGEQVGIMYKLGAFTRNNLLNSQNVTLMGEIVDHDVTYFDLERKKDPQAVVDQFAQTIKSFTVLASQFYSYGLLPEDLDAHSMVASYAEGIFSKLDQTDRELLQTTLEALLPKSPADEMEGYGVYERLKKTVDDYPHHPDIQQDALERMAPIEKGVAKMLYTAPDFNLKHYPRIDILGRADVRFVTEYLVGKAA